VDERGDAVGFSQGENEVTGRKELTSAAFVQLRRRGPGTGVQAWTTQTGKEQGPFTGEKYAVDIKCKTKVLGTQDHYLATTAL